MHIRILNIEHLFLVDLSSFTREVKNQMCNYSLITFNNAQAKLKKNLLTGKLVIGL